MNSNVQRFHITNATHEDFDVIFELFSSGKTHFFGETRRKAYSAEIFFSQYVTHRFLIHISEKNPMIIGYAEVSNSPYIPALPEDCWMSWLNYHYCPKLPLSGSNTYFFNTFIYNQEYNPDLVKQVLCEIFYRENKIRYVIVPQCPEYGFTEEKGLFGNWKGSKTNNNLFKNLRYSGLSLFGGIFDCLLSILF